MSIVFSSSSNYLSHLVLPRCHSASSIKRVGIQGTRDATENFRFHPCENKLCLIALGSWTKNVVGNLKMTLSSIPFRQHREKKIGRPPGEKRFAGKDMPGKLRSAFRRSLDPCDNSNDSGLGFDHHTDNRHQIGIADRLGWPNSRSKKAKLDVKNEHDEDNDEYCFPETIRSSKENISLIRSAPTNSLPSMVLPSNHHNSSGRASSSCAPISLRHTTPSTITLSTQLPATSRYSGASLCIVKQPEQQHRARYQTEGSRGAVKDREGNGFPVVQLNGYHKPATLQVFIGTDVGKVSPHMFYQACKVSGKNSTPCTERKIEGTCIIELQLDPTKEMSASCDCVGILKERNVDVEHRFPEQLGNRSKKKSTRCRMIFRTTLNHEDGRQETLQVGSYPIVCTQPPGVPEISKKSLTSCPATGGLELFVLGKNFSKDTKVYFQQTNDDRTASWEQNCIPDKEFLQQTHFVCVVPPYRRPNITEPVSVRLFVVASGKASESHQFVYTPVNGAVLSVSSEPTSQQTPFFNKILWSASLSKREQDLSIMPPPESSMVPSATRRPSLSQSNETLSPPLHSLKQEYIDENSQNSVMDSSDICQERYRHISESSLDVHHGDSNISMINENSVDVLHHNNATTSDLLLHDDSNLSQNEKSDLIIRRNSLSQTLSSMNENSLDVNVDNSSMTIINEDSSCSNAMQCAGPSNQLFINSNSLHQQNMVNSPHHRAEGNDSKGMDLTVKFPMSSVVDLVCNNPPSMVTLQNFGITESTSSPLPTQSGQSVENYLAKIRVKNSKPSESLLDGCFKNKIANNSLLSDQNMCISLQTPNNVIPSSNSEISRLAEPTFMSSQQAFVLENNPNNMPMIPKAEHMEERESSSLLQTSLTTTCQLEAFLNSTADNLMNHPSSNRSESVKDNQISLLSTENQSILMPSSSSLMVSSVMKSQMPSTDNNTNHAEPSISSEVILNSHVPTSIICHTSPSALLPQDSIISNSNLCLPTMESTITSPRMLIQPSPGHVSPSEMTTIPTTLPSQLSLATQEKEVILEAAVDLFQTQKQISNMECLRKENKEPIINSLYMNNFLTIQNGDQNRSNVPTSASISTQLQTPSNDNFNMQTTIQSTSDENFNTSTANIEKTDFTIPISVKEMHIPSHSPIESVEKKIEDRMIPQGFTTLSENELINFINPSCFGQGNNYT